MQPLYELLVGILLVGIGFFIGVMYETARNEAQDLRKAKEEYDGLESVAEQLDNDTLTFGDEGAEMNVQENASIADVPPTTCWVCGKDDFEKEVDRNLHVQTEHTNQERAFAMTTGKTMDPHDGFIGDE